MDYLMIMNYILTFILKLYADPGLPRNIVQIVISFINNFLVEVFIPSLRKDIISLLEKENINNTTSQEIEKCFKQ